ncbi:hypothetical protein P7C73_g3140, partial [Tremellales sp. Uapishka_1]
MTLQKDIIGLLPPELAWHVLSFLPVEDILACGLVSTAWYKVCNEQGLWARLCALHQPLIRPAPATWTDIALHRSPAAPTSRRASAARAFSGDEGGSDDEGSSSTGTESGDPSAMQGGLRRNVWERSSAGILPRFAALYSKRQSAPATVIQPPILSHLPLPSPIPQPNFKHLFLLHRILSRRMTSTGRPANPKILDAITSSRAGGLPGHDEAIYSLQLFHQPMKIAMLSSSDTCPTCITNSFRGPECHEHLPLGHDHPHPASLPTATTTITGKNWLLSGSRDHTLRLWQLSSSPRVVKVFSGGHQGSVLSHFVARIPVVPSSPSTSPLKASGSSSERRRSIQFRMVAVSGGSDGRICLWDLEGPTTPEKVSTDHEGSVLCVRGDAERVVSCSKDRTIRVFDIQTLEQTLVIASDSPMAHRAAINAIALSNECIISASGDKTIKVWSIHNGELLASISAHSKGIASIDFDPTPNGTSVGTIVAGSSDASIRCYELVLAPRVSSLSLSQPRVTAGDVDVDMRRPEQDTLSVQSRFAYSASCNCPLGLGRPDGSCGRCLNRGHTDLVRSVSLGQLVTTSGCYDSTVKMWDRKTGRMITDLSGYHTGRIFAVVHDRYRVVSSGLDCKIVIWNYSEGLDTSFLES